MKNLRNIIILSIAALLMASVACYSQQRGQETKPESEGERTIVRRPVVTVANDKSPDFVIITPNRPDMMYEHLERVSFTVKTVVEDPNRPHYLYICTLNKNWEINVLYPAKDSDDNRIRPETPVTFPPKGDVYEVEPPFGMETVFAILTHKKVPLHELEGIEFYSQNGLLRNQQGEVVVVVVVDDDDKDGGTKTIKRKPDGYVSKEIASHTIHVTTYPKGERPQVDVKKRIAILVIGNIYQSERFTPLPACQKDGELIRNLLIEHCQFKPEDIYTVEGKDATKANVLKLFASLKEKSDPGMEVYIYWSSHGGSTSEAQYLVLYDSRKTGDLSKDLDTYVTANEFEHWLDQYLSGRRVVIILDACHSGSIVEDGAKSAGDETEYFFEEMFARQDGSKNIRGNQAAILCSSGKNRNSYVNKGHGSSIMTSFVVECIQNTKGPVTFDELCKYVKDKVPPAAKAQYGDMQMPGSMNHFGTFPVKPE